MNPQVFFILESFSCSVIFLRFFLQSVIFLVRFSCQGSLKRLGWPAAAPDCWGGGGLQPSSVLEIRRWNSVDDVWANGGKLQNRGTLLSLQRKKLQCECLIFWGCTPNFWAGVHLQLSTLTTSIPAPPGGFNSCLGKIRFLLWAFLA